MKNTSRKKSKSSKNHNDNFDKEYQEIFSFLNIDTKEIRHEWNKEGDTFEQFSLFKKYPDPIITPNTYTI